MGFMGNNCLVSRSYATLDNVAGSKGSMGVFSFGGCFKFEPKFSIGTLYLTSGFGLSETPSRCQALIWGNMPEGVAEGGDVSMKQ